MVFTQRVPKELAGEVAPLNGALSESALASLPVADFGLYLHVPFCNVRCGYCDFNTYTSTELRGFRREDWANSIGLELDLAKRVIGDLPDIQTIFIGGCTPKLLQPGDFEKVFDNIESAFTSDIEITIEANPDNVTKESLSGYFKAGINRISFGMQSAVPSVLKVLDRTHDPKAVSQAVELAAEVGFKDISLDLIYGTPTETDNDWTESLLQALSLPINHFSAYSLIVEPGTKLHQQVKSGQVASPDDDISANRYLIAESQALAHGFNWYEVSNWGKGGARCRHNEIYWQSGNWWGAGPGAHSHVGGTRWWNKKHPTVWAQDLASGDSPAAGREVLTPDQLMFEAVMLSLRTFGGLAVSRLENPNPLLGLAKDGLIDPKKLDQGHVVLTLEGRLLADLVLRTLMK